MVRPTAPNHAFSFPPNPSIPESSTNHLHTFSALNPGAQPFPPPLASSNPLESISKDSWSRKLFSLDHIPCVQKLSYSPPLRRDDRDIAVCNKFEVEATANTWKEAIHGFFAEKKPYFPTILLAIEKIWKVSVALEAFSRPDGSVIFKFGNLEERDRILTSGPWFVAGRFLHLRPWSINPLSRKDFFSSIPAWIRFPNLPLQFWSSDSIGKIASVIGNPLYMDESSVNSSKLRFVRVCVEISASKSPPAQVLIEVEGGDQVGFEQMIEYERKIQRCEECRSFGHSNDNCIAEVLPSTLKSLRAGNKGKEVQMSKKSNSMEVHAVAKTHGLPLEEPGWTLVNRKKKGNTEKNQALHQIESNLVRMTEEVIPEVNSRSNTSRITGMANSGGSSVLLHSSTNPSVNLDKVPATVSGDPASSPGIPAPALAEGNLDVRQITGGVLDEISGRLLLSAEDLHQIETNISRDCIREEGTAMPIVNLLIANEEETRVVGTSLQLSETSPVDCSIQTPVTSCNQTSSPELANGGSAIHPEANPDKFLDRLVVVDGPVPGVQSSPALTLALAADGPVHGVQKLSGCVGAAKPIREVPVSEGLIEKQNQVSADLLHEQNLVVAAISALDPAAKEMTLHEEVVFNYGGPVGLIETENLDPVIQQVLDYPPLSLPQDSSRNICAIKPIAFSTQTLTVNPNPKPLATSTPKPSTPNQTTLTPPQPISSAYTTQTLAVKPNPKPIAKSTSNPLPFNQTNLISLSTHPQPTPKPILNHSTTSPQPSSSLIASFADKSGSKNPEQSDQELDLISAKKRSSSRKSTRIRRPPSNLKNMVGQYDNELGPTESADLTAKLKRSFIRVADQMEIDKAALFIKWINTAPDGEILGFANSGANVMNWTPAHGKE